MAGKADTRAVFRHALRRPSIRAALLSTGLFAVALALRLWGLTRQSIWIDEFFTLKYAGLDRPLTPEGLLLNLQGPLHAAFLHFWTALFGWGELSVRLPQALASALTVPLLYVAARPVFGHRRALAGSLLLMINPFAVWYAQEVRNYAFVMLFAVLSLAALGRFDGAVRPVSRVPGLAASWIAGLLCNLSFSFHIAAGGIWGALRSFRKKHALVGLLAAGAITAVALLPWAVEFYNRRVVESHLLRLDPVPVTERLRGEETAPVLGLPYAAYVFSVGFSLGPSLRELRESPSLATLGRYPVAVGATAVCFGLLSIAGLAVWVRGDAQRRLWLLALLVPPLLAFVAAFRNVKVFNPRYAATALPAYVLLLAEGAWALKIRGAGGIVLAGAGILCATSLVQLQTVPRYWKEDTRGAAAVLQSELAPGDFVFMVCGWDPIARYYWPALRRDTSIHHMFPPFRRGPEESPEDAAKLMTEIRSARRAYVVFCRDYYEDPDGRWEGFLRGRFAIARAWELSGARIWKLGAEVPP